MTGQVHQVMAHGIENTECVVVFITSEYRNKVNGTELRDNCHYEFAYAARQLGPQRMVPVVMEKEMKNSREWKGILGANLGGLLYIDMSDVVEGTAEWMGAHFVANSEQLFSRSPSKISNKSTQPRSPANPPPAPSLDFQSVGTTRGPHNHHISSTNISQLNSQQNITLVTSPPKAASWLEQAVQLVRGVKSNKNTSQQIHEIDQGNRVSLAPISAQQRQEVQVPLRPLRLQSLSRNSSSEHNSTQQIDSLDTLPGPQIPLRDPFGQEIISRTGPAKMSALNAVSKTAKEHDFPQSYSVSGLQRPRVHVTDTDLVHGRQQRLLRDQAIKEVYPLFSFDSMGPPRQHSSKVSQRLSVESCGFGLNGMVTLIFAPLPANPP
jgi:hypothetical protein